MAWSDRARTALVATLLLLSAVGGRALAQPNDSAQDVAANKVAAREAYKEGQRLVEQAEYKRALAAFKRGYAFYEDPVFLFNIAQCHRLLAEREPAVKNYRAFLERVPDPPNLADIQRWLAQLDRQIEVDRKHTAATQAAEDRPVPQGTEPAGRPVEDDKPPPEPVPTYKKWWPWTILAVGVVGIGLGVGLGLGLRGPPPFNETLTDFGPGTKTTATVIGVRF